MQQAKWPTGLGCIFSPSANSNSERRSLNPKAMIPYKRCTTIWQIQTTSTLVKTRERVKGVLGPCGHCALCDCQTHQINGTMCFTKDEQNQNLSAEKKTQTMYLRSYLCEMSWTICRPKTWTNFPRDGHRTAVRGTDHIVEMTKMIEMRGLTRHYSVLQGIVNERPNMQLAVLHCYLCWIK